MTGVMHTLVREAGIPNIDLEGYYFSAGKWPAMRAGKYEPGFGGQAFRPHGYFYGPIRAYVPDISDLDAYKIVLMLRDPRDVLTSLYFTTAYNHYIPTYNPAVGRPMEARRREVKEMTIDEYVLEETESGWLDRYAVYCQALLHRPNVLFVKYEHMIGDFSEWLRALVAFLDIKVDKLMLDSIVDSSDFSVDKENIYSNKRQVLPGDHRRKLDPKTIDRLTARFENVLNVLGYL
jgi:hypothetical protein